MLKKLAVLPVALLGLYVVLALSPTEVLTAILDIQSSGFNEHQKQELKPELKHHLKHNQKKQRKFNFNNEYAMRHRSDIKNKTRVLSGDNTTNQSSHFTGWDELKFENMYQYVLNAPKQIAKNSQSNSRK